MNPSSSLLSNTDFINASNLSPQDAFLLSLHAQIADLQDELRLYRKHDSINSRYYYATFQVPLSIPEWNHWVAPELLVGRNNYPLDPFSVPFREHSQPFREPTSRVYILLQQPSHLVFQASHQCVSMRPLDSFEFYQGIRTWVPGENDAWAWCRSFPGEVSDPAYQTELRVRWTDANLTEWVSLKE